MLEWQNSLKFSEGFEEMNLFEVNNRLSEDCDEIVEYQQVILQNQKMGDELKAVTAPNGNMILGLIPQGWGSIAQVKVDGATGDIGGIERVETPQDKLFAIKYLRFLESTLKDKAPIGNE